MAQTTQTLIKERIKVKLEEIDKLQEVYDKPQLEFGGMPAATITPAGIEAEPDTNGTDLRTYIYKVKVFYDVDRDTTDSVGLAVDALYDVADDILDKFTLDKTWESPDSFADSLPEGYTMLELNPVVGEWNQEDERSIIYVDIDISIKVLRDTGACS